MFLSHPRQTVFAALKVCLVLGLLLLPFAISAPARALQTDVAPHNQAGGENSNVEILKEVQNPDGTTTVTVRFYATSPQAPDTNFGVSQDTYITSGNPTGNYASATSLGIGYDNTGPAAMRMLLQFNLSSIPSNATVDNATVYIYQFAASPSNDAPMGFQAQYAVSSWAESNVTWNNANYIGGASLPVGNFPSTLGWLAVNSTNLFKTWVSGQQPNYGLIVTGDESPSNNRSRYFRSSSASSNGPYADVTYTTGGGCAYTTAPTSYVNALPTNSSSPFTVSWTGTAYTPSGCAANGISSYVVWYQVNHGDFIKWLDGVYYTSAQFNAANFGIPNGSLIGFRSQAVDYHGNKTPAGDATASTTINPVNPPAVVMNPLATWTTSPSFVVSWTGIPEGGAPITSYNFEVNINNAGWTRLLSNTPQTSFQYSGANSTNYQFRAQASNNSGGSFGPWSSAVSTTIDSAPPSTTMDPLPEYTTATAFWASWSGADAVSGIAYYNVQYQISGGAWQTLINNTSQTSFYVQNGQTGQKWGFRVQAVDKAGNTQSWPESAQASTTIFVNPIAVVLPFNPPLLESTAPITKSFTVNWAGYTPPGTYLTTVTILYRYNSGAWTLWNTYPYPQQTSATFNWFDMPGLGDGLYQFKATAANNALQAPYELPEAYWRTMIVDMAGKYQVHAYMPIVANNAP